MVDRIPIAVPDTGEAEWHSLKEVILSGWVTQGPKVHAFENAFAEYHGVDHAIAVTSGTSGLHVVLAALEIGPGDEVIIPAFTWVSTANVVEQCGATPVFCDVDPLSFNIDASRLRDVVSKRTKAIIPVHLFGLCASIDEIRDSLPDDVVMIEDAACACGAEYKNVRAGGLGDAGVFSFHPRKTITTGEGGMVTTNSKKLAALLRQLRNHGLTNPTGNNERQSRPYYMPEVDKLGFNYRMTDIQAAIGLVQLNKLDDLIMERAKWADWYRCQLNDIDWLIVPEEPDNGRHGWQSFVVKVDPNVSSVSRNEIMDQLDIMGVSTRPGTYAVHLLEYYRDKYGVKANDFPNSRSCFQQSLAIPLHNRMTSEDYQYVIDAIRGI